MMSTHRTLTFGAAAALLAATTLASAPAWSQDYGGQPMQGPPNNSGGYDQAPPQYAAAQPAGPAEQTYYAPPQAQYYPAQQAQYAAPQYAAAQYYPVSYVDPCHHFRANRALALGLAGAIVGGAIGGAVAAAGVVAEGVAIGAGVGGAAGALVGASAHCGPYGYSNRFPGVATYGGAYHSAAPVYYRPGPYYGYRRYYRPTPTPYTY